MKNVTKERDFIYRLPFACVCMLINKDALILNEDTFKHMHRTSRHKSVLTILRHHLHLYDTISTSTTPSPPLQHLPHTSHPDNEDEKRQEGKHIQTTKMRQQEGGGRCQWRWRWHTRCTYDKALFYSIYLLCSDIHRTTRWGGQHLPLTGSLFLLRHVKEGLPLLDMLLFSFRPGEEG